MEHAPAGEGPQQLGVVGLVERGDELCRGPLDPGQVRVALREGGGGDEQLAQVAKGGGLGELVERVVAEGEVAVDQPAQHAGAGAAVQPDEDAAGLVGGQEGVAQGDERLGDAAVWRGQELLHALSGGAAQADVRAAADPEALGELFAAGAGGRRPPTARAAQVGVLGGGPHLDASDPPADPARPGRAAVAAPAERPAVVGRGGDEGCRSAAVAMAGAPEMAGVARGAHRLARLRVGVDLSALAAVGAGPPGGGVPSPAGAADGAAVGQAGGDAADLAACRTAAGAARAVARRAGSPGARGGHEDGRPPTQGAARQAHALGADRHEGVRETAHHARGVGRARGERVGAGGEVLGQPLALHPARSRSPDRVLDRLPVKTGLETADALGDQRGPGGRRVRLAAVPAPDGTSLLVAGRAARRRPRCSYRARRRTPGRRRTSSARPGRRRTAGAPWPARRR